MSDAPIVNYTVLADAIVLQTNDIDPQTKRPVVLRAMKGQTFDAHEDDPRVAIFKGMKSIRPTKDVTGNEHITARSILLAFKDEGTADVVEDVTPVDAPKPVEGASLLASSLTS